MPAKLRDLWILPHNVLGVDKSRNCIRWSVADDTQDSLACMIPACLTRARVVAIERELIDDCNASLRFLKSCKQSSRRR
jgi:type II secretory pathway component PulL